MSLNQETQRLYQVPLSTIIDLSHFQLSLHFPPEMALPQSLQIWPTFQSKQFHYSKGWNSAISRLA